MLQPATQAAIGALHQAHKQGLQVLPQQCRGIERVRVCGTIAAFEVRCGDKQALNAYLKQAFVRAQLILRPIGNTVYLIPPYSLTSAELLDAYVRIAECIGHVDEACESGIYYQGGVAAQVVIP